MKLDVERYRSYVDGLDISEEKKIELIRSVWLFLQNSLDRAVGDDPVQICLELQANKDGQDSANMIDFNKFNTTS